MNAATKTTFKISNVQEATRPVLEVPYKEAVETLLSAGTFLHDAEMWPHGPLDVMDVRTRSRTKLLTGTDHVRSVNRIHDPNHQLPTHRTPDQVARGKVHHLLTEKGRVRCHSRSTSL
jgi:hypothetical protein